MPQDVSDNVGRHLTLHILWRGKRYENCSKVGVFRRQRAGGRNEHGVVVYGIQKFAGWDDPGVQQSCSLHGGLNVRSKRGINVVCKIQQQPERRSRTTLPDILGPHAWARCRYEITATQSLAFKFEFVEFARL